MMQLPVEISIIIPAYQEEQRIKSTLEQLSAHLGQYHPGSEIILVSDGCTDGTVRVAKLLPIHKKCTLNIIELEKNAGKGDAVRRGMLAARGKYQFFTDADLSFPLESIEEFVVRLQSGADLVIAQRKKSSAVYAQFGRRLLAAVSGVIICDVLLPGIKDAQSGFKAFQSDVAQSLFRELKTSRYLFDLELLLTARRYGYRIDQVPVDWYDRPGSKVRIIQDTIRAAIDLLIIAIRDCRAKKTTR